MRVLLDHCVPVPLAALIHGHSIETARDRGWDNLSNGNLLRAAIAAQFDAVITADQSMARQIPGAQPLILVIVLQARTNRMEHLAPLTPKVIEVLGAATPPGVVRISSP